LIRYLPSSATTRITIDWERQELVNGGYTGFASVPVTIYEATADPVVFGGEKQNQYVGLREALVNFDVSGFTSLYLEQDLAVFAFPSFSPMRWEISPSLKAELTCAIANNQTMSVTYEMQFNRLKHEGVSNSAETVTYKQNFDIHLVDSTGATDQIRDDFLEMMQGVVPPAERTYATDPFPTSDLHLRTNAAVSLSSP
jgi:hypothetical protein